MHVLFQKHFLCHVHATTQPLTNFSEEQLTACIQAYVRSE